MKYITFKKLVINSFQGYGNYDTEILLDNPGIVRLLGENGAGKSSVIVAIETCLFNNNYKSIPLRDLANTKLGNGFKLELHFAVNNRDYVVENCRNFRGSSNTYLRLFIHDGNDWVDISAHTITDTISNIEDIIGVDYKTFNSLVSISADNTCPLIYSTDKFAREFMSNIFNLDVYDAVYKKVADRLADLNREYSTLEENLNTTTVKLEYKKAELEELNSNRNGVSNFPIDVKPLENEIEELEKQHNDTITELANLNSSLNRCKKEVGDCSYTCLELDRKLEVLKRELYEKENQYTTLTPYTYADSVKLGVKEKYYIDELETCRNVKNNPFCNTCGQSIDPKEELKRIPELEKHIEDIRTKLKEVTNYLDAGKHLDKLKNEVIRLDRILRASYEIDSIKREMYSLEDSLGDSPAKLSKLRKELLDALAQNSKAKMLLEKKEKLLEEGDKLEYELGNISLAMHDLQHTIKVHEILKNAYSPKGIKSFRIERILQEINTELNSPDGILDTLSNSTLSARISPIKNNKNTDSAVESINVTVADSEKELPFFAFSEGEKKQVALALVMILHDAAPIKCNLLMLDEVTSNLSTEKRVNLFKSLSDIYNDSTKTILVVSHDDLDDVNVLFTDTYEFQKLNGFCTLKEK